MATIWTRRLVSAWIVECQGFREKWKIVECQRVGVGFGAKRRTRDDEIEIHVNLFIFYQQGSFGNKRAEDKHANGCSGISLNVSFE